MEIRFHIVTNQTFDCHDEQITTKTQTDFVCEEETSCVCSDDVYQDALEAILSDGVEFREALEEYIDQLSSFNADYPNSRTLQTIREEQLLIHMKSLLDDLDKSGNDDDEDEEE